MAVLAIFSGSMTRAQYDTLRFTVDWARNKPVGAILHAASFDEGGDFTSPMSGKYGRVSYVVARTTSTVGDDRTTVCDRGAKIVPPGSWYVSTAGAASIRPLRLVGIVCHDT